MRAAVASFAAFVVVSLVVAGTARARPDDPGSDLFTFDVGDEVVTYDTPRFRVHYATAGVHRVPLRDDDGGGVPDHVERLGIVYESALTAYEDLGFRAPLSDENTPDNGGDGRFDVYLVDFARAADGAWRAEACVGARCSGYMVVENDFAGYGYPSADIGNRVVGSHELFHAVQAAYSDGQGAVLSEGTAVWASERFDPSLNDLEGFSSGYLEEASSPLDAGATGPVDAFSYGASLFFQYLDERYGPDVVLHLWESVDAGVGGAAALYWFDTIDDVLQADAQTTFAEAFAEFSSWTLLTGVRADASRGFADGDGYAQRSGEVATLPFAQDRYVLFSSSSRLLRASTGGRASVGLRLTGDASATEGVRAFLLAVLPDGSAGSLVAIDDVVAGGVLALSGADAAADRVLALLVNTRRGGQGARPRVCLGAVDEVDACAAGEGSGEGEGEGEGGGDVVDVVDVVGDEPEADEASGCATRRTGGASAGVLGGVTLLALGRRRRHR